jgi:hypothetical protein
MNAIDQLKSILCDPEGKCCIAGTDEDRAIVDRALKALAQPAPSHPDDLAVDRFATAMKEKMAKAREKGRSGWETCPPDDLSRMLREHVEKGDPRDVANFAMMLWSLGVGIAATPPAEPVPLTQAWRDSAQWLRNNYQDHPNIASLCDAMIEYGSKQALEQPAMQQPYGYVSTHTNGLMHFNKTFQGVYTDTATEIVAVYTTQPVQDVAAYLFTNVQSGDIESSTDPDHKQDERELWYREELVRQHHHTKKAMVVNTNTPAPAPSAFPDFSPIFDGITKGQP